jgi:hypothetical protein
MIFLPPIFRIFFLILIMAFFLAIAGGVRAFESSSTKFQIHAGSIESISGTATSTTFQNRSAGGQNATGYSTSSIGERIYSGILYWLFGTSTTTPPTPPPGGGGFIGAPSILPLTPEEKARSLQIADFNSDNSVNITDLSILLYYFGKSVSFSSASARYDLNGDGLVDITDISILLYYWR